jgi:hypothetical protein
MGDLLLAGLVGLVAMMALVGGLAVVFDSLRRRRAGEQWTGRLLLGLILVLVAGFATSWVLFLLTASAR